LLKIPSVRQKADGGFLIWPLCYNTVMEILDKTKDNLREANKQIIYQSLGLVSSAFVLVAALAWNDAIRELISQYLKAGNGLISRFIYAILVTAIAAVVTMRLNKISEKYKDN
jgi:Family of unknown function (DUF5654)